ncbi:hypothetical protein ANN_07931 [Periplaneta americana]|uniref:Tc1-like transposase DDE domain-containing protein n=1 Tax=Periplaneta americana TaxID=6978 RepID=A0ABQ8T1D5_PERAM|nr:hypothetical protein ANN_07931 [Periplaneta americana]
MWTANNWHLHHDNAPAHSSQLIHTFLAKHGITTVRQPPYSPDLAPCDFWLFPKLKTPLKGSRFESREEIMRNATRELNTIPKEDFQRCFRQWKDRKAYSEYVRPSSTVMKYKYAKMKGNPHLVTWYASYGLFMAIIARRTLPAIINAGDDHQEVVSLSAYIAVNSHLFCCHNSIQYFYMAFSKYRLLNINAAMCVLNLLQKQSPAICVASNDLHWRSSL